MNRLYTLRNVGNCVKHSKCPILKVNLCKKTFCHSNLIHRNKHFISNFYDQQQDLFEEQTKKETQKQQTKNNTKNINKQKTQDPNTILYSENLRKIAKQFSQQTAFYIAPLQYSRTFHYASYFLPTVRILHSKKLIKEDKFLIDVFRQVKNSITPAKQKFFTPQSVVRLMQEFSMIDFDGDESISLNTMLEYAKKNMTYFTQTEWEKFKEAYKDIMVNKAVGPVRFKPLTIQKNYQSQTERKNLVIRQNLQKIFNIDDFDINKEISMNYKLDKKWVIIKVPSKKLTIITYPKSLSFQPQEAYSYIYDLKHTINTIVAKTLRQKNRLLLQKLKVNIQIRQYFQNNESQNFQHLIQRGLVYRQKKQIIDEFQKYEEMKKMSLKEQIQKMKEKKKQLKQKQKFKEKQKNIENPAKLQNKNKRFDFFQTLKHSINQIQQQTLQKLNKTKTSNQIPKKKKKKAERRKQKMQNDDEQFEDEDQQIEQEDEIYDENPMQDKIKLNPVTIEKMKVDLQTFRKRVAQKQQKSKLLKKEKSQLSLIQPFINVQNQQITIENILNKVLANSTLQQIKEFNAYVEMIESFNKIMDEIDKVQRVKDYTKRVQQSKRAESAKGFISEKRFRLIADQLNGPLDTNIEFSSTLEQIFQWQSQKTQKQSSKANTKIKENTDSLEYTIVVMSEEQLLDAIEATRRKQIMKNQETNDNTIKKQQTPQQIELKEKILKQSFLSY